MSRISDFGRLHRPVIHPPPLASPRPAITRMRYRTRVSSPNMAARVIATIVALVLGLLAVFLFAAFAVVAVLLAAVGLIRLWWMSRQVEPPDEDGITVEYTVQAETIQRSPELPPRSDAGGGAP